MESERPFIGSIRFQEAERPTLHESSGRQDNPAIVTT
jgi:hypothetical protein